jgi:hypothetical protein
MELILIEFSPGLDGGGIVHSRATGRFMVLWCCGREREQEGEYGVSFFCGLTHAQPKELANGKRNLLNLTQNL